MSDPQQDNRRVRMGLLKGLIECHWLDAQLAKNLLAQLEMSGGDDDKTLAALELVTSSMEVLSEGIERLQRELGVTIAPGSGEGRPN